MAETFFISDTHFGHRNILKFESRERPGEKLRLWDSIEEMNESLVDNWNKTVGKNDWVWHLGDFYLGSNSNIHIAGRLNGHKKLVMGNHEHAKARKYLQYFNDVVGCAEFDKTVLTHIPVHPSQQQRFRANIHGHLHEYNIDDPWYINVSCEQIDYTPIPYSEIRKRIEK